MNGWWCKRKDVVLQMSVSSCYKLIGDAQSPATKQLLLTRYVETIGFGNAPVSVAAGAIPPPAASAEEDGKDWW